MARCQRHAMTDEELRIFIGEILIKNPPNDKCSVCLMEQLVEVLTAAMEYSITWALETDEAFMTVITTLTDD